MLRSASVLTLAVGTLVAVPAHSAGEMSNEVFINKGDLKWSAAPPSLPKGAKLAVLQGDPGKSGPFTIRLTAPANYKIAPHWHTQAENLTIISGTLYLGMGDKAAGTSAHALNSGGYHYLPAKQHHYAFTKSATQIQISGDGPFDINYINAADNPDKSASQ